MLSQVLYYCIGLLRGVVSGTLLLYRTPKRGCLRYFTIYIGLIREIVSGILLLV